MSDLNNIKKLNPFGKFCCTVGHIPTSYMVSLSYEEQLIWFCNFLEKTVIPTVNNNADSVEELQNLYIELKNYVDNYFENLDVQEEINNKLDEMAESGVLNSFLQNLFNDFENEMNENLDNQNNRIQNFGNEIDTLIARMNTFETLPNGSTSGDAELADIRVGADGNTYTNAGTSVRTQIVNAENSLIDVNRLVDGNPIQYPLSQFSSWGKYSATSGETEQLIDKSNLGVEIDAETVTTNLVLTKNSVNFQSKKLTLSFDMYVYEHITEGTNFRVVQNNNTNMGNVEVNNYPVGSKTKLYFDINPNEDASGSLQILFIEPCHIEISNVKLTNKITRSSINGDLINQINENNEVVTEIMEKDFVIPSTIPCIGNYENNVFYDNILLNTSIDKVERISIANSIGGLFNRYLDKWRIFTTPQTITQTFTVNLNNTKDTNINKQSRIIVMDKNTTGVNTSKKVMFIGDSLTNAGVYEEELLNIFNNDVSSITLYGTRGIAPVLHEGRGGWTAKNYCQNASVNDVTNPFYNNGFDFNHYMENNPNFNDVDYVFINLGTNDMANNNNDTITYYQEMVNSIKEFNSNIVVFIGLCPPLSNEVDDFQFKNKRIELAKLLLTNYDNKQNEKIIIAPYVLNFDASGFPSETLTSNRYVDGTLKHITDNTHPLNSQYYRMADTSYFVIKYAMYLSL